MRLDTVTPVLAAFWVAVAARIPLTSRASNITLAYITQNDPNPASREAAIQVRRAGYLYGPPLLGNGSFFPTGDLGQARVYNDVGIMTGDLDYINALIASDAALVGQAIQANSGFNNLDDYANILYNKEWRKSIPAGEAPGLLTNYTQDLLFSMERLSLNPYPLHRLKVSEALPFTIPDQTSIQISTLTLTQLWTTGRLFVVDHSYLANYDHATTGKYGAACAALFYIHPLTGSFLPLAIKINVGSKLIYTPLDTANDWLLAKMMFNSNDAVHADFFHVAAFHDVGEIVYEAALRTLGVDHPVMLLLDRLAYAAFGVRPIGEARLFSPGGLFDQSFYYSNLALRQYVTDFYPTLGRFEAAYIENDFAARGLINASWGPALHYFPFYDDASHVKSTMKNFITSFIQSYYSSDSDVAGDTELQAWFIEASGAAQVIDFPCSPSKPNCTRTSLINLLTHFAFLTGAAHHVLNTGDLTLSLGVLPFHPFALYAPIPTTKNVASLLPFMPPPGAAINQTILAAAFNRPQYEAQNKTLAWAYSDPIFLAKFNSQVARAAGIYQNAMFAFSKVVRARKFDSRGLSQGMPFVYRALDPGTIPWFFAI